MPVASATDLVNALRASRLLTAAQLEELAGDLQRRHPDAKALGRALIDRQWLTPYQANLLLQGSADKLILGPYVILERLGDNPLGQVHKARHQLMNRLVTLTVVREELLSQASTVEQFYQEIQANSQLSEPHLVHAYDAGPIGRTHFFATEHVEGVDLEKLVAQTGRLPVPTACAYVRQVALGLQHAHERKLVHHDLRPANLLVAKVAAAGSVSITTRTPAPSQTQLREATIKIANLGLSVLQPRLRGPAVRDGTMDFAAPEQAAGSPPDMRANLYSLGCIFYFLLAGKSPFASDSSARLRHGETHRPLENYRRDVPGPVRAILDKLMATRPEDRFRNPGELLTALTAGVDARLMQGAAPVALPVFFPMLTRGRLVMAASVLAALLVLGCAGLWALLPRGTDQIANTRGTVTAARSAPPPVYVKKDTYEETILATLKGSGLPSLEGTWYTIAPFDNGDRKGFGTVYPPETEIDLRGGYPGKDGQRVTWNPWPNFKPGVVHDLKPRSSKDSWAVIYLLHELEVAEPVAMDLSLGSDDTLTFWHNGKKLVSSDAYRGAAADQNIATLNLQPGKNQLLAKICQGDGDWKFYVMPRWPAALAAQLGDDLQRDFPGRFGTFLSDLPEIEPKVGHGGFGKNGDLGYGNARVRVGQRSAAHALSMHPGSSATASVGYQLDRHYKTFKATAAINDTGRREGGGPVVFTVVGDGKELWKSRPLRKAGEAQDCTVSVADVERLELRATCPGGNDHAHAVWLDPRVQR